MGHLKHVFNILLVIQACSLSLSVPYGHPDAEAVEIGSQVSPALRNQLTIEAGVRRGMDGDALTQLLHTKQPVVKVNVEPNGDTKTTTYKLEPDGSISSKTVTERKSVRHFDAGSLPGSVPVDELLNSPSGTVTRNYIDKDGSKVTQTYSIRNPKTTSIFDNSDNSDWFSGNAPSWINSEFPSNVHRNNAPQDVGPTNYHKSVTYTGPNGKKSVVESWSSDTESHEPEHKFPTSKWLSFNSPELSQPRTTLESGGDWVVAEGHPDVETTPRHKYPSWTTKTWDFPEVQSPETTTYQRPFQPKATTPLPSLEDFLKTQYVQAPSPTNTVTSTPRIKTGTTSKIPTPVTIKVEDLPVTQVLHNGKPADENIIKMLPPHLKPKSYTETVHKTDNILPTEENTAPRKVGTNVLTLTKTHFGNSKPTLTDLDPQMQDILRNAGISPDDITNIDGDTITKTRTGPDGRIITTKYKVHSSPTAAASVQQTQPNVYTTSHSSKPLGIPALVPHNTPPRASPIAEFLEKVGLTESHVLAKNGEYTRTFIDDDGQVLTATFVLSRPMNESKGSQHQEKPLK